jgi:hypothetical protein
MKFKSKRKQIQADAFRISVQSHVKRMAHVAIRHFFPPVLLQNHEAHSLADLPQWP